MADRWTSDQNIKFMTLYKDQTNLWNCLDPNYKNRDLRKTSLEYIQTEMNMKDTNEVTKKIKNLRSTYNQELQRVEKSKKSGCAPEDVYKSTIKWFDCMDYIMKIVNLKDKETTSNLERQPSTSRDGLCGASLEHNSEVFDNTDNSNNTIEVQAKKSTKRQRCTNNNIVPGPEIQAAVNELVEINTHLSNMPEDECDAVSRHVAFQLRQLRTIDRIDAIDEIQATLSKYRKKTFAATKEPSISPVFSIKP